MKCVVRHIKAKVSQRKIIKNVLLPVMAASLIYGNKPNFVIFVTDDQEFSEINYFAEKIYGKSESHTPNIDALAENGIVFTNGYTAAPTCTPSRYAILTGRHAGHSEALEEGVNRFANTTYLEKNGLNLQSVLKTAGYKTGMVGKWHLDPDVKGPNEWAKYGLKEYPQNADPKTNKTVNEAMKYNHDLLCERTKQGWGWDYCDAFYNANMKNLYNDPSNIHNIEHTAWGALQFLDTYKDDPFFLYFSTTMNHGPHPGNMKNGKLYLSVDADLQYTSEGYVENPLDVLPSSADIKARAKAAGIPDNMAFSIMMDDAVGVVIKKLKEIGQYENTVFIFITDHNNTNHGKGSLYDNGVNIPFIVSWPGKITPGESDELVQTIDIAATFFDYAGAEKPFDYHMDGKSLRPYMEGNMDAVIHSSLYLEFGWARGVVTKDAKYIALRYPADIQKDIDNGGTPPIYTKGLENIGKQASTHNPFYFDNDQLFEYKNSGEEDNLLYNNNGNPIPEKNLSVNIKDLRDDMKVLLTQHLQNFEGHPYYEFFDGETQTVNTIRKTGSVSSVKMDVDIQIGHLYYPALNNGYAVSAALFRLNGSQINCSVGMRTEDRNILSLSNLSKGIYLVVLKANEQQLFRKLITVD